MTNDKKEAARKAAGKFSTDLTSATMEYARLTQQVGLLDGGIDKFKKLQDEMLLKIPLYRHPCSNEFVEYMIFFDPDCINITGSVYQQPEFEKALEKEGVSKDLILAIKKYAHESELRIVQLAQCKDELDELKAKFSDAQRIYDEFRNERSDKRNALVAQAIGLSSGKPTKRLNYKKLYFDYVTLIRKKGFNRRNAVESIKKKYELNSYDAALTALHKYRTAFPFRFGRSPREGDYIAE